MTSTASPATRRYAQLSRVHATAELLRQHRHGWTLETINREIGERLGEPCHVRTTRRDLVFLELLGLAERSGDRWRWRDPRPLMEAKITA